MVRKSELRKLEIFEMRCLRSIMGVTLLDKIRNEDIRKSLNITNTITEIIAKRRMKWFGHVIRMPQYRLPQQAYSHEFRSPRLPGRPPARWKDQIPKDTGMTLQEAERQALKRLEWRRITSTRGKGHVVK